MGYVAAAAALIGVGAQLYGMSEAQGAGKLSRAQKQDLAAAREAQKDALFLQRQLQPFVLDQMGLEAEYTSSGAIKAIRKKPETAEDAQARQIHLLAGEKVLKGLRGELGVDPASTRRFNEDARQREEYLARTLGPDYKLSTAGQTGLERGLESRRIAESAIRRGEMTAAESIAQGRISNEERNRSVALGLMRGFPEDQGRVSSRMLDSLDADLSLRGAGPYSRDAAEAAGIASIGGGLLKGAARLYGYRPPPQSPAGMAPSAYDGRGGSAYETYRAGERAAYGSTSPTPYYAYAPNQRGDYFGAGGAE